MALDIAPSLAKVMVDGSNPFARSRFRSKINMLNCGDRLGNHHSFLASE